jgi:hypothetical protein
MRNDLASALGLLSQEQQARMQKNFGAQLDYAGQELSTRETVARVADGLTKTFRPVLFVLTDERLIVISKSSSGSAEVVTCKLSEITEAVVYPISWSIISKLFGSNPRHNNICIRSAQTEITHFISEDSDIQFEAALRSGFRGNPAG